MRSDRHLLIVLCLCEGKMVISSGSGRGRVLITSSSVVTMVTSGSGVTMVTSSSGVTMVTSGSGVTMVTSSSGVNMITSGREVECYRDYFCCSGTSILR